MSIKLGSNWGSKHLAIVSKATKLNNNKHTHTSLRTDTRERNKLVGIAARQAKV